MKKSALVLALFATLINFLAYAQHEQVVVISNKTQQTVYDGYIANQFYGDKGDAFYRIYYTAFQKDFLLKDESRQDVTYVGKDIPPAWREWASANHHLKMKGGEETFTLSRIAFEGEPMREYYILLDGKKHLRCYTIAAGELMVKSDSLLRLERFPRDPSLITDLDDVVTTLTDTYVGVITRQYPGRQLQIWDRRTDKTYVVDYATIRNFRKEVMNPDYSIWEQAPYLQEIVLRSIPHIRQEGIIVEQTAMANEQSAIKLLTKGGTYTYKFGEILSISKFQNPEYKPVHDIILDPGQTVINRDSLLQFVNILKLEKEGLMPVYYLDPQIVPEVEQGGGLFRKKKKEVETKELKIVSVAKAEVVIETNTPDIAEVYVIKATEREEQLVPKKNPVKILSYTDADLIRSTIKVEKKTSINNTTSLSFKLPEEGRYFVYLRGLDKSWIFEYKKVETK